MPPRSSFEVRTDAGPSTFLSQELEYLIAEEYRVVLPPLKIFDLIPVDTSVDYRAAYISYSLLTQVGSAAVMRSPNSEIPQVDIYRQKFTSPVKEMLTKYSFSVNELEAAELAGVPLDREGADAARRAMAELASRIALKGDAASQLPGLLTNPNIPRFTVANGTSGYPQWSTKTADEIITDLTSVSNAPVATSSGAFAIDTVLLPISQFNTASAKARTTASDTTALRYVLQNNPYIKRIEWLPELKGAGTGGTDMMIAFASNPRNFAYYMVMPFEQRPQQERDLKLDVICREKSGGVIVKQPLSLIIAEGI